MEILFFYIFSLGITFCLNFYKAVAPNLFLLQT